MHKVTTRVTRAKALANAEAGAKKIKLPWRKPLNGEAPPPHIWGPPPRALYALTCYTIENRKGRWYVIKTNVIGHRAWRGPYADLNRATLAIARFYQREVTERHTRRSELYGVPE